MEGRWGVGNIGDREHREGREERTLKTYSNKELMTRYDVSAKTFKKWMDTMGEDFGPRIGNYYSPKQVKAIFARYGKPFVIFFAVGIKILLGDLIGRKEG